jgi:hypothetical protein
MEEPSGFLGSWTSVDRYVGGMTLDVRAGGDAFIVQRFEPWGTPIGLPVLAVAQGSALVAADLGNDEAGMVTFTLADGGAVLELRMPDTERPILFRRATAQAGRATRRPPTA